jgi:hypothetical protein
MLCNSCTTRLDTILKLGFFLPPASKEINANYVKQIKLESFETPPAPGRKKYKTPILSCLIIWRKIQKAAPDL